MAFRQRKNYKSTVCRRAKAARRRQRQVMMELIGRLSSHKSKANNRAKRKSIYRQNRVVLAWSFRGVSPAITFSDSVYVSSPDKRDYRKLDNPRSALSGRRGAGKVENVSRLEEIARFIIAIPNRSFWPMNCTNAYTLLVPISSQPGKKWA